MVPTRERDFVVLLTEIEQFERHEDGERAFAAIVDAFDACDSFERQERLAGVLRLMACAYFFDFPVVLERFWANLERWQEPERRALTLMSMVQFVAPDYAWSGPAKREQMERYLKSYWSSGTQQFLLQIAPQLWQRTEQAEASVAAASALLLGAMHGHAPDDLLLLLELCAAKPMVDCQASLPLAAGRAGEYTRVAHGTASMLAVAEVLRTRFEARHALVATTAIYAHVLVDGRLPAPAGRVLAEAEALALPVPELWRRGEPRWRDVTTRRLARIARAGAGTGA